jgi:hypothetical protein
MRGYVCASSIPCRDSIIQPGGYAEAILPGLEIAVPIRQRRTVEPPRIIGMSEAARLRQVRKIDLVRS